MKSFQSRGEIKSNIVKHIIYTNDIFTDYKDTMLPLFLFFVRSTRFWVISLLMLLSTCSVASLSPIILDHHNKKSALGNRALYLEDPLGIYSIADIRELNDSSFEVVLRHDAGYVFL